LMMGQSTSSWIRSRKPGISPVASLSKALRTYDSVSVISASGTVSRYDEVGLLVWTSTGFDWLRLRTSRGSGMEVAVDTVTAR
jgi:hypothetical protein